VQNGATTAGATSLQTGSVTPSVGGSLLISGSMIGNSISGFTATVTAVGGTYPGAIAYLKQGTAAAINPAWSFGGSSEGGAVIASFKP
jgi:hypothetical protein